jgi:DnaK suppressor protein
MLLDMNIEDVKERLHAERKELTAASESTAEARRPASLDQQSVGRLSRMDSIQMQAMAIETERRRRERIRRIDATLARIDEGEFGYCVRCGDAIAEKRLNLDPTVPLCATCAHGAN